MESWLVGGGGGGEEELPAPPRPKVAMSCGCEACDDIEKRLWWRRETERRILASDEGTGALLSDDANTFAKESWQEVRERFKTSNHH